MSFNRFARLSVFSLAALAAVTQAQKMDGPEKPLDVIVQSASIHDLQNNIEALGNLRANESTVLTAKTTKAVSKIHFEDGQRVTKGTILVEMMGGEESAAMEEARLTAEEAKKQLERSQSLAKTGALSPAALDQLTSQYTTAQARYMSVAARYKDLLITAPFSGVVGIRNISEGSLISPGQTITTLNDDSKMKLDFTVPAIYLNSLRVAVPMEAQSRDLGDKVFKGQISSIDNQIDENSRSIKVRALLDNSSHLLKQGMLMSIVIHSDARKALVISEAALVPMGSNNFVFVLKPGTDAKTAQWIAERRQVKIGQRYRGSVEILSGLNANEKVVTHGLQKIHAGQSVKILAEQHNDPNKPPEPLAILLQQSKAGKP